MARYSLPGDNVFPEGITEGGGTTFYVGSMGDGTIFRGDAATGVRAMEAGTPPCLPFEIAAADLPTWP